MQPDKRNNKQYHEASLVTALQHKIVVVKYEVVNMLMDVINY